jgi:PKD domain
VNQAGAAGGGADSPPVVDPGGPYDGAEHQPVSLEGSVYDDSADAAVTWGYQTAPGAPANSCQFSAPHELVTEVTCAHFGDVTLTLTADDGFNRPEVSTTILHLGNVAPAVTITAPVPWQVFDAGTPVTLVAPISDGTDATTCTVDWDDGTAVTIGPGGADCRRQHTYDRAGMYTVTVNVTDEGGLAAPPVSVLLVVIDRGDGWANVDGSMATSAGATVLPLAAAGDTWVHVAARYYPNSGAEPPRPPVGDFKAWVANADFRFDSGVLDWLVVTPDDKVAVKGYRQPQRATRVRLRSLRLLPALPDTEPGMRHRRGPGTAGCLAARERTEPRARPGIRQRSRKQLRRRPIRRGATRVGRSANPPLACRTARRSGCRAAPTRCCLATAGRSGQPDGVSPVPNSRCLTF